MRSFILGIMILMAVPAYAVGQQRDRSERSATGRTAVQREEAVQAAPAKQTDGRPEPRRGRATPSTREEEESGDTSPSRAARERLRNTPNAARTGRLRDEHPQGNPWLVLLPGHSLAPFPDRERRRSGQRDGDDWPRYQRPHGGANVVFVPYAVPVVEREVVIQREVVEEPAVPVMVEQPSVARLILDVHPPTAQVFADGYYIGIPEDFRFEDGGAVLEPGPHRIDIVAHDHAPVSFDVNLARGQSATFRHILTPITGALQPGSNAAVKELPAPKQPTTFYLIPGCYMGNVPPKDANLPATCEIARAVSFQVLIALNWIFTNSRTEKPYAVNGARHTFDRAVAAAGITDLENVTLHTLRHTASSRMIASGFDDYTVMSLSGHSSTKMLAKGGAGARS